MKLKRVDPPLKAVESIKIAACSAAYSTSCDCLTMFISLPHGRCLSDPGAEHWSGAGTEGSR